MPEASDRPRDVAAVALFSLALIAPLADFALRPGARAHVAVEMRQPEPFPAPAAAVSEIGEWPRRFERWWGDAIGLRAELMRVRSLVRYGAFGQSPSPSMVAGRDGWLFLATSGILDDHRGVAPLSEARLEGWRRALESRRDFCAALGAEYVFAIAPEKSTVYPEKLPVGFERLGPSSLERLGAWLAERSSVRILDFRDVLARAQAFDDLEGPLYYPHGTHWCDRGIVYAYERLVDRLRGRFPDLEPLPRSDHRWIWEPTQGDSWAARLYLQGLLVQRLAAIERIEDDYDCYAGAIGETQQRITVYGPDPGRPRLVMFHDSTGDRLRKLLAATFAECTFAWTDDFDAELVLAERPDVVVDLYGERKLATIVPGRVPLGSGATLERAFAASQEVLLDVDPAAESGRFAPVGATHLSAGADGLVVEQLDGASLVELPQFRPTSAGVPVLWIDIECERDEVMSLLYQTHEQPLWRRGQVYTIPVQAGRNRIHFELHAPDMNGRLQLRPGREGGRFVLRGLEVRAVGR